MEAGNLFFQLVLFLAGAMLGLWGQFLPEGKRRIVLYILMLILVAVSSAWGGYEYGIRQSAIANVQSTEVPTQTSLTASEVPTQISIASTEVIDQSDNIPIQILLPDGTPKTINVTPIVGEIGRLKDINQIEGSALPVQVPPGWDITLPNPLPDIWNAYQLPHENNEPCTGWPSRFNSVSMRYNLSGGTVLIFAERGGNFPVRMLLPIANAREISILGELFRTKEPLYEGPLNASIQVFLATPETKGTITVYDGHNFTGNQCTIVIGN